MKNRHFLVYSIPFLIFAFVRVTRTSKAMQTTAFRTVAYSLPQNEVILLTFLISERFIPYTDLQRIVAQRSNNKKGSLAVVPNGQLPFGLHVALRRLAHFITL